MKTETLKSLHKRATIAGGVVVAVLALLILVYLIAVEKGALRSVSKPLVQKSAALVASNLPPVKAVTVAAAPSPSAPDAKPPSPAPAKQVASSPATTKADVADPKPAATNIAANTPTPAHVASVTIATKITSDDERVARHWLADTNHRPALRVQYRASDILRLTTELNRGLLVAGSGTTNRRELFLQSASGKSPLFSTFTKSVAQNFADYSLALNPSTTFDPLTTPLQAYFPDGDYDLAFVPDRVLATDIFAKAASALRALPRELASSSGVVFEGQLRLIGFQPTFDILEVKQGTNRHAFVVPKEAEAR